MGTEKDIRFGVWLRRELEARGYELEGARAGGKAQFAQRAGISASIVSRILSEDRVPEVATLRKIGDALGIGLGRMLIAAGLASPRDFSDVADLATLEEEPEPHPRFQTAAGDLIDPADYSEEAFLADLADGFVPPWPPGYNADDTYERQMWDLGRSRDPVESAEWKWPAIKEYRKYLANSAKRAAAEEEASRRRREEKQGGDDWRNRRRA